MFNGKYTHINEVIEKLYRRYKFTEIYEDDVKEAVWDFVGLLGRPEILEFKNTEVIISAYRGVLPTDIYELDGIREKISKQILTPSNDLFFKQNRTSNSTITGTVQGISYIGNTDPNTGDVVITPNEVGIEVLQSEARLYGNVYKYNIEGDYIFTGLENCTLEITYKAFPTWDDGTPKIPDDAKVLRALQSYVALEIARGLVMSGKISKQIYDMIDQDYSFDVGAARNRLIQPDKAQMENIKRMGLRLLPKPNQYSTGFKYLDESERLSGI